MSFESHVALAILCLLAATFMPGLTWAIAHEYGRTRRAELATLVAGVIPWFGAIFLATLALGRVNTLSPGSVSGESGWAAVIILGCMVSLPLFIASFGITVCRPD